MSIHYKKQLVNLFMIILVVLIFIWSINYYQSSTREQINSVLNIAQSNKYSNWHLFKNAQIYQFDKEWFLTTCLQEKLDSMSLEFLPNYLNYFENSAFSNCKTVSKIFYSIFELEQTYSEIKLTDEFEKKVLKWLDNNPAYLQQAYNQKIIKLYNKYLHEEMIYNPLRGKRPQTPNEMSDKNYSLNLIEKSKNGCDFCEKNYKLYTASDIFGRIESDLSYTAANTFKYDKWHSLIVSRNHNTLYLTENEVLDMFNICLEWFSRVNEIDNKARYPELVWDSMPKSGASQVHTHLQVSMGLKSYYGAMRRWLDASSRYFILNERSFFEDFILVHKALGLAERFNDTYVIANLIPVKEQELILIGSNTQDSYTTMIQLINRIIRIFVDEMDQYSFSMVMYLPELDIDYYQKRKNLEEVGFFPKNTASNKILDVDDKLNRIFCRIVFRTPVTSLRSDMNGLDLYTSSVLGIDRYKIANKLFKSLSNLK